MAMSSSAMNRSTQYAADHPDEARATIPTFTKIPAAVAQKFRLPVWLTAIYRDQLTQLIAYTKQFGVIDETFPVRDMIWNGAAKAGAT